MKITALIVVILSMHVYAVTYGQTAKITMEMNSSFRNVIERIEDVSGYHFVLKLESGILDKIVNVKYTNEPIEKVLDDLLNDTGFTYKFIDKYIAITPIEGHSPAVQQQKVSGKVTDGSGSPLPGVTVVIKGTNIGAITDVNGNYAFSNISNDAVLVFSFVGMKTQEMHIGGSSVINVVMQEETMGVEEVVVVGYGIMKKSDVNASIVSVKPEELVKVSSANVSELLAGRAAGLTVTQNSAQPGGGINVLIRGAASTGAGNEPLYVIDGFPIANAGIEPGSGNQWSAGSRSPLNDINPNDITSIEILKDASATAIYGARGSNGVILITTKRGGTGTKVEYNFNTSVQTIVNKPELLNKQEFMIEQDHYLKEYYLFQNHINPYGNTDPSSVSPYIPKYSKEEIANAGEGTNWYDLVTRRGKINQHNLTISHGNENAKSLFSLNYYSQEGVIKTSGLERFSLRYNLDQKITKWWNYGVSSLGSLVKEKNATLGDGRDATAGIIESALNYSPLIEAQRDPVTGAWIEDPNQALLNHPLSYLDVTDNTKTKRFLTTLYTNIYFNKDLWIKLSAGADIREGVRQNYFPKTTRYGNQVGGDANINSATREDYLVDAVLNYQKEFNNKHKILALAGYSYQDQNSEGAYARAMGFSSDALYYYALQAGEEKPIVSSYRAKHVLASYFTRLQYSFEDKYLFTFTGRVDGSDRFGENNRYAFFPSAAFSWRMIQEDFLKDLKLVSDMKLRLSVGRVGNENIANDAASEYYAFQGRNYYFEGVEKRGVNLAKMPNPDLKWETTTEFNAGIDFGFFRNRVSGSVDAFYKEIEDLLSYRALPHTSIVSSVPWNVGKTQSKGLEITVNTINVEGPLRWETDFTFTSYRDKWLERDPKVILQPYQSSSDPLTAVFTLIPDGVRQPDENTPTMPALLPGQQKYKDINGLDDNGQLTGEPDGIVNQADVVYRGTVAPKFTLGLNNTWEYKGFNVDCFIYASVGGLKWPTTRMEHGIYGTYGLQRFKDNFNFLKEVKNRWSSENMEADEPSGEGNSYDIYGAPYWEKASYLRLKSLSVGYDITRLMSKKLPFTVRLYVNGQNLFTITRYNGLDPETENDRASYPQQRTFSLGVDVKF